MAEPAPKHPRQLMLERINLAIARQIQAEMQDLSSGPPVGFAFLTFDFGPHGFIAYNSNANREDMIEALRELVANLEGQAQ